MSTIGEKEYYEMRYFTADCAAKTSKTPKMTLAEIYANAIQGCPPRSRSPLETCLRFAFSAARRDATVPLPEPGAPNKITIFIARELYHLHDTTSTADCRHLQFGVRGLWH